jgi:hypothetical protein
LYKGCNGYTARRNTMNDILPGIGYTLHADPRELLWLLLLGDTITLEHFKVEFYYAGPWPVPEYTFEGETHDLLYSGLKKYEASVIEDYITHSVKVTITGGGGPTPRKELTHANIE